MKIGINGFGRIGRQIFRMVYSQEGIEVAHINDVTAPPILAALLEFDSTHGRWEHRVLEEGPFLHIDGTTVSVGMEKDPLRVPWREKGVDVVIESTGAFRKRADAAKHLTAGAKKVLVSAPGKDELDGDFVIGVNDDLYKRDQHDVISIGSCTTNCLAPVAKAIHSELGIVHGMINTVHAYTASQKLVDGPSKTIRRGRAAAENLIPTTTGASSTIGRIIPELNGKLQGLAVRAPLKCGSLLDLTCTTEKETTVEEVNAALRKWASGPMQGILAVEDAAIVSSDIIGTEESAIVSSQDTMVVGGHLIKVLAWYDNEWAFSRRCVDMATRML